MFMFRIKTQRFGTTRQVFTWEDPRKAGYKGDVEDEVRLDYDMEAIHSWPDGEDMPKPCLGRSPENPKHYKVFKYPTDLQAAGFEPVPGTPLVFGSWLDYIRLHLDPPDPDQTDEEDWYSYLDKTDEESRRLRARTPWPESPKSARRDDVAEWVAKQHFIVDTSIREIWYLPQGSPPHEIRLLELSERLPGNGSKVEPMDFGLKAVGESFRLSVADVTSEQLEQIKQDPACLPTGWRVDGNFVWRRRGA